MNALATFFISKIKLKATTESSGTAYGH